MSAANGAPVADGTTTSTEKVLAQTSVVLPRHTLKPATTRRGRVRVAVRKPQNSDIVVIRPGDSSLAALAGAAPGPRVVLVQDLQSTAALYESNADAVRPIASITKLMTALVVADSGSAMSDILQVSDEDVDRLRHSSSRLPVNTRLSRADLLRLTLMSSENRAASTLSRYFPGGQAGFVFAMNQKAKALGMYDTRFTDPTGLSAKNVSTAGDLIKLLQAVNTIPLIRRYTTQSHHTLVLDDGQQIAYSNSNSLVTRPDWDISISKTGYIRESGECLVMIARIDNRDFAMVLLNSGGRATRVAAAVRLRQQIMQTSDFARR